MTGEAAVFCSRARRADPRRLRLHQGLPRREVLPRRQDLHHRRGHQRGAAAGDRPRAAARHEPPDSPRRAVSRDPDDLDDLLARLARARAARRGAARSRCVEDGGAGAAPSCCGAVYPRDRPGAGGRHHRPAGRGQEHAGRSPRAPLPRAAARPSASSRVDPTSPFTGGALLGDRIRMQGLATDPGVFIRSMATRGAMGGLARATRDAVDLLDAAGFDWVLVETVGVGQDEVDVVASVDTVVVVDGARPGRRHPGDQGRHHGDRRRLRDQQGRPRRRRARGARPGDDAALEHRTEAIAASAGCRRSCARWRAAARASTSCCAAIERHRAHLEASGELASAAARSCGCASRRMLKERVLAAAERARRARRARSSAASPSSVDPYALAERFSTASLARRSGRARSRGEPRMIGSIDHIGIAVRSIAEARGFYEALGLASRRSRRCRRRACAWR